MTRTRTFLLVAVVAMLATMLLVAGCSGGTLAPPASSGATTGGTSGGGSTGGTATGGTTVKESGFAFNPAQLEVKVGDTVTFTNEDSAPHNVEIDGKQLGEQAQGASVTWKAEKAGAFPFKCVIHPTMTGQITVK